jgi:hypothetical protein
MPEESIEEILKKSREARISVRKGVPAEDAARIYQDSKSKVESGEWEEIFHKVAYGHNNSYPMALSVMRYWGHKDEVLSELLSYPEKKECSTYDVIKSCDSEKSNSKERSIYLQDQFIVKNTGEILSVAEMKKLSGEGKLDPSETVVRISSHKMNELVKKGQVGLTHELVRGYEIPGEKYRPSDLFFEELPAEKQSPADIIAIYKSFGKTISPGEAAEKLISCVHGKKDEMIVRYSAREKIRELFMKEKGKLISEREADEILRKYEKMREGARASGGKYDGNTGHLLHRHWEIEDMHEGEKWKAKNPEGEKKESANGQRKTLESIVFAMLLMLAAINFYGIAPGNLVVGNAVLSAPPSLEINFSNLALGIMLLAMAATVLVILLEDRRA